MRLLCLLPLLVLGAFFWLVLPPRQTADLVGMVCALAAHLGVTAGLLWLGKEKRGLLLRLGWSVTLPLYWLAAVGVTVVCRLLSVTAAGILLFVQLTLAAAAGGILWSFWLARGLEEQGEEKP